MFLSPGIDLTGYKDDVIQDPSYKGAGLWTATASEAVQDALTNVLTCFYIIVASYIIVALFDQCRKGKAKYNRYKNKIDDFDKAWWDLDNEEGILFIFVYYFCVTLNHICLIKLVFFLVSRNRKSSG